MATTLSEWASGNNRIALVVAIDGFDHLISNEEESAVQSAWSSTDWAAKSVIAGLVIELDNQQSLNPWEPFGSGGKCIIKVQPDRDDTLGVAMSRTDSGAETVLDATADRTSTLFVGFADGFPLTGEAHCGTECFSYGFVAGRGLHSTLGSLLGSNRGKYVAHGVKDSVATYGAVRFGEHHRVAVQNNGVRFAPIVSEFARTWRGRRVSVWAHTVTPLTGALNSKADALCIFLGELTEIQDDSDTGHTHILCESILDRIPKTTLLRDQWSATVDYGMRLQTGQKFRFVDYDGTSTRTATPLVVVARDASGSNEVNAGWYAPEEIASILNSWWAGESGAGRIHGNYYMGSPEDLNGSPRSVIHHFCPGASTTQTYYKVTWPFSGWAKSMGFPGQFTLYTDVCGTAHATPSPLEVKPFDFVGPDNGGTLLISIEQQVGIFQNQRATLPIGARDLLDYSTLPNEAGKPYGLFLLECETPMVLLGTIEGNYLRRIRVLSSSFTSNLSGWEQLLAAKVSVGGAAPRLRQIFVHEGPVRTVLKWIAYSTGTLGYNHPDYDVLPHGQGLGIPYDALGPDFEASCDAMPGSETTLTLVLEKPRTLTDVIRADLVVRNAHLAWREGGLRIVSWSSPSSAVASTVLDESDKAEPIDNKISQRSASVLDSTWVRNYVKLNYNRDISAAVGGGEDSFTAAPLIIEDATSIDDNGGIPTPITLDLRNVYNDTDQIGQGVRALAAGLTSWLTYWSRPLWKVRRSIAPTLYESTGIGDCVAVTDPFVRDPTTGQRGIVTRPGLIVGHRYRIQTAPAPEKLKFAGEIDVVFLHNDRTFAYAPSATVDHTANTGGFTAGYDGIRTFRFLEHEHSESNETVDVGRFAIDDEVLLIEIDPDDPSVVDYWERTVTSVDEASNQIVLDAAPSSPAFDSGKRYRLTYNRYALAQGDQSIKSFQAGTNKTIGELSPPDVYGEMPLDTDTAPTEYDHTRLPELLADVSFGPNVGAARDCGYDKELALLLDHMMDHQTRRSSPAHDGTASTNSSVDGWQLLRVEEVFIGDLIYANGMNRYLSIAPHWRSTGISPEVSVQLRVSVSGYPPYGTGTTIVANQDPGYVIKAPAASNTWSIQSSSTIWHDGDPRSYPLGNFNGHQYVFIIIEGTMSASVRGLYQVSEGERIEAPFVNLTLGPIAT